MHELPCNLVPAATYRVGAVSHWEPAPLVALGLQRVGPVRLDLHRVGGGGGGTAQGADCGNREEEEEIPSERVATASGGGGDPIIEGRNSLNILRTSSITSSGVVRCRMRVMATSFSPPGILRTRLYVPTLEWG